MVDVNLTEYVDRRISPLERMDDVIRNEMAGLERRLVDVIPRTELITIITSLNKRIGAVEQKLANYEGRLLIVGISASIVGSCIPLIIGLIFHAHFNN